MADSTDTTSSRNPRAWATKLRDFGSKQPISWAKGLQSSRSLLTSSVKTVLVAVILSALVGFSAGWLGARSTTSSTLSTTTLGNQKKIITSESQLINAIAQTVGPSVVSVNVTSTSQNTNSFFGLPQSEQSAGTGIILTSSGLVMTNRHVVPDGTTSVSVTLQDGTELKNVSVVGRTAQSSSLDVAFLKINDAQGKKLAPASLGDSSKVQVGDAVVAIGNALGQFQNTITSGIVSGYGRSVQASSQDTSQSVENLDNLFQTDAAINEGNSGGPLVNLNGQVIGMNTAIAGNAQNIGFAIPINDVKGLIDQVMATGKLEQPWLGVYYIPLTNDVAQQYSLDVDRGAWVPSATIIGQDPIVNGGPADKAGIKTGDVITKVDGTTVNETNSLTAIISKSKVGQTVKLTILRDSKTITLDATLEAMPDSSSPTATTQSYRLPF
jgi:S1-C subfamily serine protease